MKDKQGNNVHQLLYAASTLTGRTSEETIIDAYSLEYKLWTGKSDKLFDFASIMKKHLLYGELDVVTKNHCVITLKRLGTDMEVINRLFLPEE